MSVSLIREELFVSLMDRIVAWDRCRAQRASVRHKQIDYEAAVASCASREVLASILTGLAGCHLAMSGYYEAMGRNPRPRPGKSGPSHAEGTRLEGLLLLEVSFAAATEGGYCGVRTVELFHREPIRDALRNVALAFDAWEPKARAGNLGTPGEPVSVGQRLDELILAAVPVTGHRHTKTLASLAHAHCDAADPE